MYSSVKTAAYIGLQGYIVDVETHITNGLPRFKIVGLPGKAVEEAKERVASAIRSSGYTFPLKRITVNLSPTNIPKFGSSFDIPIAIGILSASMQITSSTSELKRTLCFGELRLDGTLSQTLGTPIIIHTAVKKSFKRVIASPHRRIGSSLFKDVEILTPRNLRTCARILEGKVAIHQIKTEGDDVPDNSHDNLFKQISGNKDAKRVLTLAVSGHHHLSLSGPPGCGKTMLASAMVGLFPPLSEIERLDLLKIHSITTPAQPVSRPFRSPHHSTSATPLLGGGTPPRPGEISLAHTGVLFLDELADFDPKVIRALRHPIDTKGFFIYHGRIQLHFPADFLLITAMNECPCGFLGHPKKRCTCSPHRIHQYQQRIPGTLSDRIDLHFSVHMQKFEHLSRQPKRNPDTALSTTSTISRVWNIQRKRNIRNSDISLRSVDELCPREKSAEIFLRHAYTNLGLSTRNLLQVLRIARTIADIENRTNISETHLAEALSYRKTVDDR